MYKTFTRFTLALGSVVLSLFITTTAHAVPSFGRQTGMSCMSCHSAFPQLTPFGRQFKLQGYTLTTQNQVKGEGLSINLGAPFSMMLQTTYSTLSKAPDANIDKSKLLLPAQLSIFYAGHISDKVGTFTQITAEQNNGFGIDNTDIRFADNGKIGDTPVTYGLTLNNNPTVQDPWNSTPVWGFPWFEAGYGYEYPDTLITAVGGNVAGLTGYGMFNNHIYAELGAYGAANTDAVKSDKVINDSAPYWRLAYSVDSGEMNWEVGAFGFDGKLQTDEKLTDTGADAQLQWVLPNKQTLTLDANYINEQQPHSEHLNTMKVDLTWYTNSTWGVTAGYRGSESSDNAISGTDASNTGNWDSDAYQLQLDYTPWLNTRFALQYTDYAKLNGTTTNASDSNQWMLGGWFLF